MSGPLVLPSSGWRKYSLVGRSQSLLYGATPDVGLPTLPDDPRRPVSAGRADGIRVLSYRALQGHPSPQQTRHAQEVYTPQHVPHPSERYVQAQHVLQPSEKQVKDPVFRSSVRRLNATDDPHHVHFAERHLPATNTHLTEEHEGILHRALPLSPRVLSPPVRSSSLSWRRRELERSLKSTPPSSRPPGLPVRRMIPLDLFEALPESRVDPDPVQTTLGEDEMVCDETTHTGLTLTVRPVAAEDKKQPTPAAPSGDEKEQRTLVCQESAEGTVFGLLRTPTPGGLPPSPERLLGHPRNREPGSVNRSPSTSRPVRAKPGVTVVDIRSWDGLGIKASDCFNRQESLFAGQVLETVNPGLVPAIRAVMLDGLESPRVATRSPGIQKPPLQQRMELNSPWSALPSPNTAPRKPLVSLPKPPLRWSSRPVVPSMSNPLPNGGLPVVAETAALHRFWSMQEPEVREAMRQLDLSIDDGLRSGGSATLDSHPEPVNGITVTPKGGKEVPEAESDNLIEEVLLSPGSDRRTYQPPSSLLGSLDSSQPTSLTTSQPPSLGPLQLNFELENGLKEEIQEADLRTVSDEACFLEGAVVSSDRSSPSVQGWPPSPSPENLPPPSTFFVVVAIDFGTTYSGYAFSFVRDPGKIHIMRKWEGGDPGVMNQKTLTCLLLTPEGLFHSFGFAARDFFHNLEPEEAQRWMYFEKFKMTLHHSQDLCRETSLTSSSGQEMSALTVFAHALRYFREQALRELSDQSGTSILNEDVRWVVTVPAIWRAPAKQFMRTAAYQAGLASAETGERLLIALEPEAASLYCRQLRLHQLVPETPPLYKHYLDRTALTDEQPQQKPPVAACDAGTRYLVVDCGGGTVDMTLHQLLDSESGDLRELHKATGGPHGSLAVDAEFERLLDQIFGAEFMTTFKRQRPVAFLDLMVSFEARKRGASPYSALPSNVALPFALIDAYKKGSGHSAESAIKKAAVPGVAWSSQGMLRLDPASLQRLFRGTLEGIKKSIAEVLAHKDSAGVQYLFLVGGFAESPILQREIRDTFSPYVKVIIPQGVSLAILTGAVLFGLNPGAVRVRRSRLTYGVGVLHRFVHGTHPLEKRVLKDGVEWCADVLDPFVLADQSVALGDAVTRRYTPARPGQARTVLHLYCSERPDARFVTDENVVRCGTLVLELPVPVDATATVGRRREIQMRMVLGDTEVKVSALDVTTGQEARAQIDFLDQ